MLGPTISRSEELATCTKHKKAFENLIMPAPALPSFRKKNFSWSPFKLSSMSSQVDAGFSIQGGTRRLIAAYFLFKSLFFALFWHLWLCGRASYFISDHLLLKNLLRTLLMDGEQTVSAIKTTCFAIMTMQRAFKSNDGFKKHVCTKLMIKKSYGYISYK